MVVGYQKYHIIFGGTSDIESSFAGEDAWCLESVCVVGELSIVILYDGVPNQGSPRIYVPSSFSDRPRLRAHTVESSPRTFLPLPNYPRLEVYTLEGKP